MRDPCETCPDFDSARCVSCKFFDDSRLFPDVPEPEVMDRLTCLYAFVPSPSLAGKVAGYDDDLPF